MKRLFFALPAFAMLAALLVAPSAAQVSPPDPPVYHKYNVTIENRSDAWTWMTAYRSTFIGKQIIRAWCVGPHSTHTESIVQTMPSMVDLVRFEVTKANCAHPVMLDQTHDFWGRVFFVEGHDGHYGVGLVR